MLASRADREAEKNRFLFRFPASVFSRKTAGILTEIIWAASGT